MSALVESFSLTPVPEMNVWVAKFGFHFSGDDFEYPVAIGPLADYTEADAVLALSTGHWLEKCQAKFLADVPLVCKH